MSARCYCLGEILKFLWCETIKIYCSKVAKYKQTNKKKKPTSIVLPALISVVVAIGYNWDIHGKSLELFLNTFSVW